MRIFPLRATYRSPLPLGGLESSICGLMNTGREAAKNLWENGRLFPRTTLLNQIKNFVLTCTDQLDVIQEAAQHPQETGEYLWWEVLPIWSLQCQNGPFCGGEPGNEGSRLPSFCGGDPGNVSSRLPSFLWKGAWECGLQTPFLCGEEPGNVSSRLPSFCGGEPGNASSRLPSFCGGEPGNVSSRLPLRDSCNTRVKLQIVPSFHSMRRLHLS